MSEVILSEELLSEEVRSTINAVDLAYTLEWRRTARGACLCLSARACHRFVHNLPIAVTLEFVLFPWVIRFFVDNEVSVGVFPHV